MANRSSKTHKREVKGTSAPVAPSSTNSAVTSAGVFRIAEIPSTSVIDRRLENSQGSPQSKARSPIVTRSHRTESAIVADHNNSIETSAIASSSKSTTKRRNQEAVNAVTDKRLKVESAPSSKAISKSRKKQPIQQQQSLAIDEETQSPIIASSSKSNKKQPISKRSTISETVQSSKSSKRFKKAHSSDNFQELNMEQNGANNQPQNNNNNNNNNPSGSGNAQSGSSSSNASTPPLPNVPTSNASSIFSHLVNSYGSGLLEAEEMSRLQTILESRGFAPNTHILGISNPRMHHIFARSINSGASSKVQQILNSLQPHSSKNDKRNALGDLCQMLLMGNEDTLAGFQIKAAVPLLIQILQRDVEPDVVLQSARAMSYLMEALPRSMHVVAEAIPTFLQKLQTIDYMDVAEQTLAALATLSTRHHKAILNHHGVSTCLQFLDFFSIDSQRAALQIVANCCSSLSVDDFLFLRDSLPLLNARLIVDDPKCVDSTCTAFSRMVDCYQTDCKIIAEISSPELLLNIQNVLVSVPPILNSEAFVNVIRMLSIMCSSCSQISVELLKSNIAETLKSLLLSNRSNLDSGHSINLVSRNSQEIFELSALISELLPVLPLTDIFEIDKIYLKGIQSGGESPVWQWKDERGVWQAFSQQECAAIEEAEASNEDEVDVQSQPNFIIDLNAMERVNEVSGANFAIKRKTNGHSPNFELVNRLNFESSVDPRAEWLIKDEVLAKNFLNFAFKILNEVYNSSAGLAVRHRCLNGILRMVYHTPKEVLSEILHDQKMSSSIATMLSSTDIRTVVCAIQMCNILMEKLPQTFSVYFQREGVVHQIRKLHSEENAFDESSESKSSLIEGKDITDSTNTEVPSPNVLGDPLDWTGMRNLSEMPGTSAAKVRTRTKKYSSKSRKDASTSSSKQTIDLSSDVSPVGTDNETTQASSSKSSGKSKEFLSRLNPTKWGRWNQVLSGSAAPGVPSGSIGGNKEPTMAAKSNASRVRVRAWIKKHAKIFEEKYFGKSNSDNNESSASSDILRRLTIAIQLFEEDDSKALELIKEILMQSDLSLFEMIHSGLLKRLLSFFTSGESIESKEANVRLFLNIFCDVPFKELIENPQNLVINARPLRILVNKLNGCISQVEQLPIRVQEFTQGSSSRGNQALNILTSQMIKLSFMRHSTCQNSSSYKGPTLKLEPLTPIYQIERYLIQRGLTTLENDIESIDEDFSDDDVDNPIILSGSNSRQRLQLMIGNTVLPYDQPLFQAIKHNFLGHGFEGESSIGPKFWERVYPIFYRAVPESEVLGNTNSLGRNRTKAAKGSKASKKKDELWTEGKTPSSVSPFHAFLEKQLSFTFKDESIDALNLLKILFGIVRNWTYLYKMPNTSVPIVPSDDFINAKLTMKVNRQLQDVITILVDQIPSWIKEMAYACPFLFPFDTRHLLFYIASFDKDRALQRYIENNSSEIFNLDARQRSSIPRVEKRKRTVNRSDIYRSAESMVFNEYLNPKNVLEISYDSEVGTGLGPTLEFYALLSKEFQRSEFEMWRIDQNQPCDSKKAADVDNNYVFNHNGLFPSPIGRGVKVANVNKMKNRFKFLGKFMAKALMDSRMVDIPFNIVFYKWLLDEENTLNILDLHHIDTSFANSLLQMNTILQRKLKKNLNHNDDDLKLSGCTIEDLNLEFTLPGYPNIELKKNGRDQIVMLNNLEAYLNLVSHWILHEGVAKQLEAFKEGFNSVFSLTSLKIFYPEEMQKLFCGQPFQKWDSAMLMKSTKPDHGYNQDSRAIKLLFEIMSNYNAEEQRQFLQFITGSPRLPIGGFKSLSPMLTIVRKDPDPDQPMPLPSVMTCANYLKLPDYPTIEMMREKLTIAISEGQGSFHLS